MPETVDATTLVGTPDATGWSQIYRFSSFQETQESTLFVIVSIRVIPSEIYVDKLTLGQQLAKAINEAYKENAALPFLPRLKQSVSKAQKAIANESVDVGAVIFAENTMYAVVKGRLSLWLFRNDENGKLIQGGDSISGISGTIKKDDTFYLGTNLFFSSIPRGTLAAASKHIDANSFLAPIITAQPKAGQMAVLICKTKDLTPSESMAAKVTTLLDSGPSYEAAPTYPKKTSLIKRILDKIPEIPVKVRPDKTQELFLYKRKKMSAMIGLGLLIVLLVSILTGISQKRKRDQINAFKAEIQQIESQLDEASSVAAFDKQKARDLFVAARDRANMIETNEHNTAELETLKRKIYEQEGNLLGQFSGQASVFVDLSLLSNGFVGKTMTIVGENLFILDDKGERLAKTTLDGKRSEIVFGPNSLQKGLDLTSVSGTLYVLSESEIKSMDKKVEKINENNVDARFIAGYAGILYLLNTQNSRIFRLPFTDTGVGSLSSWFKEGETPTLTNVTDWTIDGTIWAAHDDGTISKFALGKVQPFSIRNIPDVLSSVSSIYTDIESESLYILEPSNKRIVVVAKDGEFKAEYINEVFAQGRALAVSEASNMIFVLTGDKLMSVPLRQ